MGAGRGPYGRERNHDCVPVATRYPTPRPVCEAAIDAKELTAAESMRADRVRSNEAELKYLNPGRKARKAMAFAIV